MDDFAGRLDAAMAARNIGVRALARRVHCDPGLISRLRSGKQQPSPNIARLLDKELGAAGALAAADRTGPVCPAAVDDEIAAIEVVRRAAASDVGEATVGELERITDDMALAYPRTPPDQLLTRVRSHLGYASGLLAGRTTLNEHRRLLVASGWLSLLAFNVPHRPAAVPARVGLPAHRGGPGPGDRAPRDRRMVPGNGGMAAHHRRGLPARRRVRPGRPAHRTTGRQRVHPGDRPGSRAWARLGAAREAREALARTEALVAPIPMPDRPEHHYQYDPAKLNAYTATTLAWLGDPAAAGYARDVLGRMESGTDGPARPRRAASARLDLALALTASDELDEAAGTALEAVTSGLLVPSNYWRAAEVIGVVHERGVAVTDLREAYREHCGPGRGTVARKS